MSFLYLSCGCAKMNTSPLTFATDRLIDYFAVVGAGEELTPALAAGEGVAIYATPTGKPHPTKTEFMPRLLDRYPQLDYPDTPFPTGIADFCFPGHVRLARPKQGQPEPLPTAFQFIATGAKGERLHGHVLTFWEELSPSQAACVDPLMAPPQPNTAVQQPPSSSSSSTTTSPVASGASSARSTLVNDAASDDDKQQQRERVDSDNPALGSERARLRANDAFSGEGGFSDSDTTTTSSSSSVGLSTLGSSSSAGSSFPSSSASTSQQQQQHQELAKARARVPSSGSALMMTPVMDVEEEDEEDEEEEIASAASASGSAASSADAGASSDAAAGTSSSASLNSRVRRKRPAPHSSIDEAQAATDNVSSAATSADAPTNAISGSSGDDAASAVDSDSVVINSDGTMASADGASKDAIRNAEAYDSISSSGHQHQQSSSSTQATSASVASSGGGSVVIIAEPQPSHHQHHQHQHHDRKPLTIYAPKCFCLLSRWSFPAFRTLLTEFYRLSLTPQQVPLERVIVNFTCEVGVAIQASTSCRTAFVYNPGLTTDNAYCDCCPTVFRPVYCRSRCPPLVGWKSSTRLAAQRSCSSARQRTGACPL